MTSDEPHVFGGSFQSRISRLRCATLDETQSVASARAMVTGIVLLLCHALISAPAFPTETTTTSSLEVDQGLAGRTRGNNDLCFDANGLVFDFATAPDGMKCDVVVTRWGVSFHLCKHDVLDCSCWCVNLRLPYKNDEHDANTLDATEEFAASDMMMNF